MIDTEPIIIDEKKAMLDLALRNAFRYAVGEIKYTRDIGFQLDFIMKEANMETRLLVRDIFKNRGVLDGV